MSLAHLQRVSLNQTFPVCLFLCFLLFSVTNKRQSDLLTGSLVPREGSGTIDDSRQYSGLQEELCSSVQCLTPFHLSIVVLCDSRSGRKHQKWGKHGRAWAWLNYYISTTRGFYLFCDNKNSTFFPPDRNPEQWQDPKSFSLSRACPCDVRMVPSLLCSQRPFQSHEAFLPQASGSSPSRIRPFS